jgi:hypothetical protein
VNATLPHLNATAVDFCFILSHGLKIWYGEGVQARAYACTRTHAR